MKKRAIATLAVLAVVLTAGHLSAQTALKDVVKVRDGIIFTGMAYEISEECGSLDARLFRGLGYLQSLRKHARELGFSNAEIDAYIDDDTEKDRLEAIAREQLALLGAVPGEEATYCTVGRDQIAGNTRVGWLLR